MDMLAELVPETSPYRFANNNPNFWSDPSGLNDATDLPTVTLVSFQGGGGGGVGMMGFSMPTFFSWGNAQNEGMGIPPLPTLLATPVSMSVMNIAKETMQIPEIEIVSIQKKKMPSETDIIGFSAGSGSLYLDLRWQKNLSVFKNGKFVHNNGQIFSQRYYGGRWHPTGEIAASKLKFANSMKLIGKVSTALTIVSAGATIVDGLNNGWQNHHTADLLISGGLYLLALTPGGWVVGGAYFIADMSVKAYSGKSITENLFDN